jgi:hypothetical protein
MPAATDPSHTSTNCQARSPLSHASALLPQLRISGTASFSPQASYPRAAIHAIPPSSARVGRWRWAYRMGAGALVSSEGVPKA